MIVFLAGNIGERENIFKELITHRLYSYHYLREGGGGLKEFSVKAIFNGTAQNKNVSIFAEFMEKPVEVPVEKEVVTLTNGMPYLEIF